MAADDNLKGALIVFGVMLVTAGIALIVKHRVNAVEMPAQTTVTVERFEAFTDEMCACRDQACAQKVSERMTEWATKAARNQPKDQKPDEEMQQRMTKIAERMATCMQKAMTAEAN